MGWRKVSWVMTRYVQQIELSIAVWKSLQKCQYSDHKIMKTKTILWN